MIVARRVFSNHFKFKQFKRFSNEATKAINVQKTDKGYCVLRMNKKPVNSLSLEFLQEFNNVINQMETDETCRGAIITSQLSTFCAGLDLQELQNPDPIRLKRFWNEFQTLALNLMESPLVLIAGINGACPAGGCAIAFACDYRIMVDGDHTIGLIANKIGLSVPFWLIEMQKLLTGHRDAEKSIAASVLMNRQVALAKGVIDETVAPKKLLSRCQEEMEVWLSIPDSGRIATKRTIRRGFVENFKKRQNEDLTIALNGIQRPHCQKMIQSYIEKLKNRVSS